LSKGAGNETRCQNREKTEDEVLCVPVHARHSILTSVPKLPGDSNSAPGADE
jgi:hypothetical protein